MTLQSLHNYVVRSREELSNRRLVSQSCIVNVGDSIGRTGQVAHTARGTAIQRGVSVAFTIVSVADISFHSNVKEKLDGHRQISIQSFVRGIELD